MSTLRRNVILALALALGLSGTGALAWWSTNRPTSTAPSPTSHPSAAATSMPAPVPPPPIQPAPTQRPPRNSVHTPVRYLSANHAVRADWDELINAGRPIPGTNSRCARAWRSSGKDRAIDWNAASYHCLDRLPGGTFKPQGVAGSGTAEGYRIGGRPAYERNLVLTSWYSRSAETELFAKPRTGETATRLVVMDLDRGRYNTVELVRTDGAHGFRNLNSHGSGLVWAGQYLYSSSLAALWMYNADDLLQIRGRFVLPAVAGWSVEGAGGLSSISIDRSTTPSQLTAINYSKDERAHIQSFDLQADGLLAAGPDRNRGGPSRPDLYLRNTFGQHGRVVRSADSEVIDGASFQGVATSREYSLANSSALRFDGNGPVDATVVLRKGKVEGRYRMPHGNIQSIYLDPRRGTYTTVTENLSRFLFTLPLAEMTGR